LCVAVGVDHESANESTVTIDGGSWSGRVWAIWIGCEIWTASLVFGHVVAGSEIVTGTIFDGAWTASDF
jgi:hypothetical protein